MPLPAINKLLASYLLRTVNADTTIQGLTGGQPTGDPSAYWYYQAPADVSTSRPAFLTYAELSAPGERGAMTEPVFSFRIYSYGISRAHDVETRLRVLFDKQQHTITGITHANGSSKVPTGVIHGQDLFDASNKFAGREVHIQFGVLTAARTS